MKTGLRTFAVVAAAALSLGLFTSPVQARMGEEGQPPVGHHLKKMTKELGLTSQQQESITAVFEKSRAGSKPLMEQMRTERRALHALIHAASVDEAAIRAQAAKVAALQADLAVLRAHTGQEIRAILTPEQAKKFGELLAKRGSGRHGMHGMCDDKDMGR